MLGVDIDSKPFGVFVTPGLPCKQHLHSLWDRLGCGKSGSGLWGFLVLGFSWCLASLETASLLLVGPPCLWQVRIWCAWLAWLAWKQHLYHVDIFCIGKLGYGRTGMPPLSSHAGVMDLAGAWSAVGPKINKTKKPKNQRAWPSSGDCSWPRLARVSELYGFEAFWDAASKQARRPMRAPYPDLPQPRRSHKE